MLTSTNTVDQITVSENGTIFYREARRVFENGVLIAGPLYHRSTRTPGANLDGVPAQVAAMAQFVWTPEVIAAYQAQQQQDA